MNATHAPESGPRSPLLTRRELVAGIGSCALGLAAAPLAQASSLKEGAGTVEFPASDVKRLAVEWAAGSVDVLVDDQVAQGFIRIWEEAEPGFLGLMPPAMECRLKGSALTVSYGNVFLSLLPRGSKALTVVLPSELGSGLDVLSIDGASGRYELSDVTCAALNVNLASGRLAAQNLSVQDLDLDMASGTMVFDGKIEDCADFDMASGTLTVTCRETCPKEIDVDAASGKVVLGLPPNDGFEARVNKLSGSVSIDFETQRPRGDDETYIYKNGASECLIDIDVMSGSVTIEQAG